MKSFDCNVRKLPLIAATGLLLGGTAAASGVELWATNNLPQAGDSDELITFDSANPAVVNTLGNTNVSGAGFGGLEFGGDGTLYGYVSFNGTSGLYTIDQGTGNATVVGALDGTALADIAYNPTDGLLYGAGGGSLYTINTTTGAVTLVGAFAGTDGLEVGLGVDAFGTIYTLDIVNDQITSGDLNQTPLTGTPVDCNFSQSITIDGASATGYHGAIGNAPAFFTHLYSFPTDGSSYDFLGAFTPDGDFPTVETGGIALPASGGCPPPGLCPADLDNSGAVDVNDLLILLANWGTDGNGACIVADNGEEQVADVNDLLALLAAWGDCPEPPDPANDLCADADELGSIDTTTVITDSLVDATPDGVGVCSGVANDGAGRWYKITGNGTSITASLCDAANEKISFDSRIHVFCGDSCTSLNCIAANDDAGCSVAPGNQAEVQFCTADGEDYYILVHMAAGGTAGDYTLVLDTDGNQCEPDAECIPLAGDACSDATPLDGNGEYPYDTTGYTTDGNSHASCEFDGQTYHDRWYTYTADFTGLLIISTCSIASYDTDMVVYDNSGPAPCPPTDAELLACNDDFAGCDGFTSQIEIGVSTGQELLIRVGGWNDGDQGPGTLSITKGDVFEFECPDGATQENEACLNDGDCANPSEDLTNGGCNACDPAFSSIACGETVCGTAYTYSTPADLDCIDGLDDLDGDGECTEADTYDLRDTDWYELVLTDAADVTLTFAADSDLLAGILDGVCPATAFLASTTIGAGGGTDSIVISLAAGTYYVFAAPNSFTGHACGAEVNYSIAVDCGEQATGACCTNGGADCADGVSEADCAADGGEFFADALCADITCTEQAVYQYDDGSAENGVTWNTGGSDLWFQRYDAAGGADTVVDIAVAFGDQVFAGSCLVGGETAVWAIYEGTDPNTATLIADGTFTVDAGAVNTDSPQTVDIADTAVTGSFFIAVGVDSAVGCFEMSLDETNGGIPGAVWLGGSAGTIDTVDLTNPAGLDNPPVDLDAAGFPSVTILRGNN